jgi:hypothetical protein
MLVMSINFIMERINRIAELREKLKEEIKTGGIDSFIQTLAEQGLSSLNNKSSNITLNSVDNAILRLMMCDYLSAETDIPDRWKGF